MGDLVGGECREVDFRGVKHVHSSVYAFIAVYSCPDHSKYEASLGCICSDGFEHNLVRHAVPSNPSGSVYSGQCTLEHSSIFTAVLVVVVVVGLILAIGMTAVTFAICVARR